MTTTIDYAFDTVTVTELANMSPDTIDDLGFGVIGLSADGLVEIYNTTEARLAGLSPDSVIGEHFFEAVAQCMNNFLVAQRFEDIEELDEVVPFVLTLRMRPTPVKLRLLASRVVRRRFVLIQR